MYKNKLVSKMATDNLYEEYKNYAILIIGVFTFTRTKKEAQS